jgi:hypothetical protein
MERTLFLKDPLSVRAPLRTIQKTHCWWQGFLNGKGPPEDLFTVERLAEVSVDFEFKAERCRKARALARTEFIPAWLMETINAVEGSGQLAFISLSSTGKIHRSSKRQPSTAAVEGTKLEEA